jgi:hypothetical protein
MRKLFWFGCAASVTAAAFVFVTARHAQKHPASLASNLAHGAYVAVGWSNPMFQACRSLGAKVAFTVGRTLAPETAQAPPPAAPCCTSMSPRCEPTTCEIPQVIDLTKYEQAEMPMNRCNTPQFIAPEVQGELACELEWMEQQATQVAAAPVTVIVTAGGSEENEPVPSTMPAAEDEGAIQQLQDVEFWPEFYDVQQQDTTEVEQLPMPREVEELPEATEGADEADGVEQGEPPDCQEMPEIDHHKSGCPSMGGCPYTGRCPTPSYPTTGKDRE